MAFSVVNDARRFYSFKNLQFERVRLRTFDNAPSNVFKYVKPQDLAANGMFYIHREDFCQCFYCYGVIGYWEEGDSVPVEHEKHFPNCPFVVGATVVNVPIKDDHLTNLLHEVITSHMKQPPPRKTAYYIDSINKGF